MAFNLGDCVKNNVKKDDYVNGDIIEKDTQGTVVKVYTSSYRVMFVGAKAPHRVPELHLYGC